jgi:hypothetical protein
VVAAGDSGAVDNVDSIEASRTSAAPCEPGSADTAANHTLAPATAIPAETEERTKMGIIDP